MFFFSSLNLFIVNFEVSIALQFSGIGISWNVIGSSKNLAKTNVY